MDEARSLLVLAALGYSARMRVFRLLVKHEPSGLPAGEIARLLDISANTLSPNFGILAQATLITAERRGRQINYRANLDTLRELMLFLVKDCCGGNPELCAPLVAELMAPCCPPERADA